MEIETEKPHVPEGILAKQTSRRDGIPGGIDELMTVVQVENASKFGRSFVEKAIAEGALRAFKIGRNVRIRASAYDQWVRQLEHGSRKRETA